MHCNEHGNADLQREILTGDNLNYVCFILCGHCTTNIFDY